MDSGIGRLRSEPKHHLTVPDHSSPRVGTLAAAVADVAAHLGLARVVVLTAEVDDEDVVEAIRLGVRGVVLKEMAP